MDIGLLPYTQTIANLMFEGKKDELLQVADKYNISFDELKDILNKELSKSMTKVATCNMALNFLIIEILSDNRMYRSVKVAIKNNIFAAAIYYVNGINKSEYV